MATLAPTTELEAVNTLLSAIGESPINSLDTLGNLFAAQARDTLYAERTIDRGGHLHRAIESSRALRDPIC